MNTETKGHGLSHDMPQGTWVARFDDYREERPMMGRVKRAHDNGTLDIVLYEHTGNRIGRESPAFDGPRGFEPCCPAEFWEPIEAPDFQFIGDKFSFGRHLRRLRQKTNQPASA